MKTRSFRLLFSGQVLSQLGDAVYEVGIVWLVFQISHSATALGLLALCQSIPFLVCGLLAGAYADRWDRRATMIVSDGVRGLAVLYLFARYVTGELQVAEICAVAVVLTTARAFFHPAMRALYPQILPREELLVANSWSEGAKRICKVGGMTLGGVLMATSRADLVLLLNAATFLLSLATIALIRLPRFEKSVPAKRPPILHDIRDAFVEIGGVRTVRTAILLASAGLILSAGVVKVGLPLLAGELLEAEGDVYGVMMACFSVGMFLSAALMKKLSRLPITALVPFGWAVYGVMFLLLALQPPFLLVYLFVGLMGFAHFLTDIPVTTLIQQKMPLSRMSACQSIWATASFGSESLSAALIGPLLGLIALPATMSGAGTLLLLLGLIPLIKLRRSGQNRLDRRTMEH